MSTDGRDWADLASHNERLAGPADALTDAEIASLAMSRHADTRQCADRAGGAAPAGRPRRTGWTGRARAVRTRRGR
jgi:hypothetical protein